MLKLQYNREYQLCFESCYQCEKYINARAAVHVIIFCQVCSVSIYQMQLTTQKHIYGTKRNQMGKTNACTYDTQSK